MMRDWRVKGKRRRKRVREMVKVKVKVSDEHGKPFFFFHAPNPTQFSFV